VDIIVSSGIVFIVMVLVFFFAFGSGKKRTKKPENSSQGGEVRPPTGPVHLPPAYGGVTQVKWFRTVPDSLSSIWGIVTLTFIGLMILIWYTEGWLAVEEMLDKTFPWALKGVALSPAMATFLTLQSVSAFLEDDRRFPLFISIIVCLIVGALVLGWAAWFTPAVIVPRGIVIFLPIFLSLAALWKSGSEGLPVPIIFFVGWLVLSALESTGTTR
jgi:hypothetical protein